jgi:ubiquitin C-terminal hydrolase
VLLGNLRILRSICNLRPRLKAEIGGYATEEHPNRCGLVTYLTSECLFGLPSVDQYAPLGPPKCKMPKTRSAAFDLLFALSDACPSNQRELVAVLHHQHLPRECRPLYMYRPWLYDRAPCGFVGLRNLGATCYMNSLLQQLFFVPECRNDMLKVNIEDRESFMYQLKLLFAHLQASEKQFYDPWDLCQVYTDYDGQPVNISQQMDVDEFLNVLFEKVEQGLKNTPQKDMLRNCFGGKIVHQIICKEPVTVGDREYTVQDPYKSEREESFYTLQLEVKHKRSILESLRLYVDGEALEGDNKYLCEEANKKVDAVKRICIKELPQTLILHLKRFEFDLDFMKKVKVNDCCEFPLTLDMDPYTLDGIERREKAAADAIQQGLDGIKAMEEVESSPDSEFELVGVLVHTGTADSGHYYSYIKERAADDPAQIDGKGAKWHLFNDIHVEPFDSQELGTASFGGSEYVDEPDPLDSTRPQTKLINRSYSAYMLFYERRSAKQSGSRRALKSDEGPKVPGCKDIVDLVLQENIRFLRDKHTYDPEYFTFLRKVCGMPLEEPAADDMATMLAVHVLMDCMIHSWDTDQVGDWVAIIQGKLLPDPEKVKRSRWLLEAFTETPEVDGRVFGQHWLKKALLSQRMQECRMSLVQLLVHAIQMLVPFERHNEMTAGAVPYCVTHEDDDSEITVIQNGELVFSLWTDHPYVRAPEYRGSPFPRPVTTVGEFIENVLDLLTTEVPRYWRNYSEYFLLLSKFADIGQEEKTFLLSRRTISRCIESVLLDDSPSGGRKTGHQFSAPDHNNLLTLISILARSVKLERDMLDEQENMSPTQICDAGPLDPACTAYIRKPRLLTKALSEGINPTETMRLIEHLCWNHHKLTASVLDTLISVLDDAHEDEMEVLFNMLDKLVAMKDRCQEQRAERMVALFLRIVLDKLPYAETCARCLEFLESLVARNPHVRLAVLKSIINPRREQQMQPRWFETCLIRSDIEKVQVAWEKLARTVALPEIFLLRQAALKGKTSGRMPPVPKVHGDDYTKTFFDQLVTKNDKIVLVGCQDPRETGCGPFPLRFFFRLLCFIIENTDGRWYKDKFRERLRLFHDSLVRLNELEGETDYAKAELFRLMLAASNGCSELLDVYTDERVAVRQALVCNFILIRPHRININFNRQHLPSFYKLLLACCQHSVSFIEYLMEANEFTWAIQQLMCKSAKYPETAAVILELIDMILESAVQPDKVIEFRERVVELLLTANDLSSSPACAVELSNRLLMHLLDDTEGMYKILDSHLLDAMLAAVGACYSPHVVSGQRPRTQPECKALEVALQAIEIIEKILSAVKSHAAVDPAVSEEVNKTLRDALGRTRDVASDHRHKAMQAIIHAVLPTIAALSSKVRLQTLQVAKSLCTYDVVCSNATADALIKLFNEIKLRQVEHVRIEHLNGDAQQDPALSEASANACTQAQQAWLSIRRRAEVQTNKWVMEYGPACRVRLTGNTKQEHNEIEAAYGDLSLVLCRNLICQARTSSNHMFYAVHLILKCALDLLPLAKLGVHKGLQELLLHCMKTSMSPEDKEQGAQQAQEAAAGSSAAQFPALPNGVLFLQYLRQDGVSSTWVERVMVCYKESIELGFIRDCARLMLSTLGPHWPADVTRRINAFLVNDLADLAGAASVLREAGDGDTLASADKRAECVALAVLRELRPLSVLDEVPTMLKMLVEDHGETACVAAAQEALEAAECRKLAQNSKLVATCLAEIDNILQKHREALADRSNKPGAR